VLRHISNIYPFIELPDLVVEDPAKITGPSLVYSNVGARLGVLGRPLARMFHQGRGICADACAS
jgi:2-keto-4-pentenoate hydratase